MNPYFSGEAKEFLEDILKENDTVVGTESSG